MLNTKVVEIKRIDITSVAEAANKLSQDCERARQEEDDAAELEGFEAPLLDRGTMSQRLLCRRTHFAYGWMDGLSSYM